MAPSVRAHPGLAIGGTVWPALLARIRSPDGTPIGVYARLLSPSAPYAEPPVLLRSCWWGQRTGGAMLMRAPGKSRRRHLTAILAVGIEKAVELIGEDYPEQVWAVCGLDHLAECALPHALQRVVIVVAPGVTGIADNEALLTRARAALGIHHQVRVEEWPRQFAAAQWEGNDNV
jgi:hypothetical protein